MITILAILAVLTAISLFFNVGFIIHEMGWYPHTRERKRDREIFSALSSHYLPEKIISHEHQVMEGWTYDLRKLGHPDVYDFKDPYVALENVINRYSENPTRSRYDDLVHLSNYISNRVKSDEKINGLIDKIAELSLKQPFIS